MTVPFDVGDQRALAIFAHPDDPEVSCGGTLRRLADEGGTTRLVICNRGEKGSADADTDPAALAETRREEVAAAAGVLGIGSWNILGHPDGELENTVEVRADLVAEIREFRPDVVICPDPTAVFFGDSYVNHRDHRAAGWATLDACAPASASPLYFPDRGDAHAVSTVLLSGTFEPDVHVEISAAIDAKVAAIGCHRSQLADLDLIDAVIRDRAADAGRPVGLSAAEVFRRLRLA